MRKDPILMVVAEDRKKRKRTKKGSTAGGRAVKNTRYTPPTPTIYKRSSRIVPILMFGFFGLGVAIMLLNYLPNAPLLPGDSSNWYLLGGLALICLGFGTATKYK